VHVDLLARHLGAGGQGGSSLSDTRASHRAAWWPSSHHRLSGLLPPPALRATFPVEGEEVGEPGALPPRDGEGVPSEARRVGWQRVPTAETTYMTRSEIMAW